MAEHRMIYAAVVTVVLVMIALYTWDVWVKPRLGVTGTA